MLLARQNLMLALAVVLAGMLNGRSEAQVKGGPDYRKLAEAKELRDAGYALTHTWRTNAADIKTELIKGGLLAQDAVVRVRANATKYRLNYYVAWDAHTVYVAFRGSTEAIHTATLAVWFATPYGVHPGLNDAAVAVLPEVKNILAAANISGKKVVIAGHSMGGVLADYVAHNLMLEGKRVDVIAMFGAPRHAMPQFKANQTALAAKNGVRIYSVENVLDWAPKSTPLIFQERIGHAIDYTWTGDVHNLDTYYAKVNETYQKVRAANPIGRPIHRPIPGR